MGWLKLHTGPLLSSAKFMSLTMRERGCWLTLLCYADQQPRRGVFHDREQVAAILRRDGEVEPEPVIDRLTELRLLDEEPVAMHHFSQWQEDPTHAERQARYRDRKRESDGSDSHARHETQVTVKTRQTRQDREELPSPPSRDGSDGHPHLYVEELTGRPFGYGTGSRVMDTFNADVRDFGWDRVKSVMDSIHQPGYDVAQLVFGASRVLHPITSGQGAKAQREEEAARIRSQRIDEQMAQRRAERDRFMAAEAGSSASSNGRTGGRGPSGPDGGDGGASGPDRAGVARHQDRGQG